MATTKLRLRPDSKNRGGKLGIYVQVCIKSDVKLFSTGQRIEKKNWDEKGQKVKRLTGSHEHKKINLILEKRHQEIKEIIFQKEINGEEVSFDSITDELKLEEKVPSNFAGLFDKFYASKSMEYGNGTTKSYRVLKNQILEFRKGRDFDISKLDYNFYDGFKNWLLKEKGQKNDTVNKRLKTLKTFMRYCANFELFDVADLPKMKMLESKPSTKIALNEDEVAQLWEYDFSKNERLEKVRDLFVFGCATGLRESDIQNLKKANIKDDTIYFNAIKTSTDLEIPLNKYSKAILEKYDYKLPKISQQKLNQYIKEVGQLAGLDEDEIVVTFQGGKRYEETVKRYSLLASHVGRRSFVTIMIQKGVPIPVIQSMTGHKDLASFQRYIKIADRDRKLAMAKW